MDKFAFLRALRRPHHLVLPFAVAPKVMGHFSAIRSQNYSASRQLLTVGGGLKAPSSCQTRSQTLTDSCMMCSNALEFHHDNDECIALLMLHSCWNCHGKSCYGMLRFSNPAGVYPVDPVRNLYFREETTSGLIVGLSTSCSLCMFLILLSLCLLLRPQTFLPIPALFFYQDYAQLRAHAGRSSSSHLREYSLNPSSNPGLRL